VAQVLDGALVLLAATLSARLLAAALVAPALTATRVLPVLLGAAAARLWLAARAASRGLALAPALPRLRLRPFPRPTSSTVNSSNIPAVVSQIITSPSASQAAAKDSSLSVSHSRESRSLLSADEASKSVVDWTRTRPAASDRSTTGRAVVASLASRAAWPARRTASNRSSDRAASVGVGAVRRLMLV
jgi:hypothetical protein